MEKQGHLNEAHQAFLIAGEEERASASEKKNELQQLFLSEKASKSICVGELDNAKKRHVENKPLKVEEESQGNLGEKGTNRLMRAVQQHDAFSNFKQIMKFGTGK